MSVGCRVEEAIASSLPAHQDRLLPNITYGAIARSSSPQKAETRTDQKSIHSTAEEGTTVSVQFPMVVP